ncbi:MAG: hypothetical protein O7D97_01955, partial [Planctomycetota bacterium]|nr:hypothetical protein [Planctomycetota bacterium]
MHRYRRVDMPLTACIEGCRINPERARMKLQDILSTAKKQDASDIHLVSGHPPMIRVHTVMTPMDY